MSELLTFPPFQVWLGLTALVLLLVTWGEINCRVLGRHRFGGWVNEGYGIARCSDCSRSYTRVAR